MRADEIIPILREYKVKNQKKYRIVNIGIFGSSARGDEDERSDVDIVVELESPDLFVVQAWGDNATIRILRMCGPNGLVKRWQEIGEDMGNEGLRGKGGMCWPTS